MLDFFSGIEDSGFNLACPTSMLRFQIGFDGALSENGSNSSVDQ